MKFTLTFKDPDMNIEDLADVVFNQTGKDYYDFVHEWTDGEYVTIQFDTEAHTATVLKDGEIGVNECEQKLDIVGKVKRPNQEVEELKRQLDEAVETLGKEENKASPYSQSLLKFIIETRATIKYHESLDYDDPETYPNETAL